MPPKSQIRSIRVSRDAFAAEFHAAGGLFIDIITQPGQGAIRGGTQMRLRDGSMSGRSPFAARRPPERTQDYQFFLGGALIKDRLGVGINVNSLTAWETPLINAATPTGIRAETLGIRVPRGRHERERATWTTRSRRIKSCASPSPAMRPSSATRASGSTTKSSVRSPPRRRPRSSACRRPGRWAAASS